jgi:hypothetical protein
VTKRWFLLQFASSNGAWLEMPETDEPAAVAALVEALLKVRKLPGEFVKISIREEYKQE